MKVAKKVNLESSTQEKTFCNCVVTDGKETYCGDHFAMYTNIESLYRTPETNTMLHANYTSIFFKGTSLVAQMVKRAYNVGGLGSIPGSGRSPGEENGNPLQSSCLENPMDTGTC